VIDAVKKYEPDIMLAHSLGSLVTYNALSSSPATLGNAVAKLIGKMTYVTFGSQIANPFVVRNLTPGRIAPLSVKQWYHLYNSEDDVFTAPIRLPGVANFKQVDTFFDIEGFADHAAVSYLSHPATAAEVWRPIAQVASGTKVRVLAPPSFTAQSMRKPRRRAVLVGINDYPDPRARLEGCVNDVYLMSSILQECDFDPEQIRLCLNERATAAGIQERLAWLLDDPLPGDQLVFFYSGHGAQLPTYGDGDLVDHKDETLVPYDFDWTPERSLTDDQIFALYSQLPYETQLAMIFDCCHSGGIHRAGSKIRGLTPPDDIRHRELRWNRELGMWQQRPLTPVGKDFSSNETAQRKFCGESGCTRRLGRAMALRGMRESDYKKLAAKSQGPIGPFLPLLLEACQEDELASEYRNGNESYGAFTFALATTLRAQRRITFHDLVDTVGRKLSKLGYNQTPQVLGPSVVVQALVPWHETPAPDKPAKKKAKPKRKRK